jgi:hypothetical protein
MKVLRWSNRLIVTEEEMKAFMVVGQKLKGVYPEFQGPVTPAESIAAQKKVIEDITLEKSGFFLSHKGTKEWL